MRPDPHAAPAGGSAALKRFIAGLRRSAAPGRAGLVPPAELEQAVRQLDATADLPAVFARAATAAGARVHRASPEDWIELSCDILRAHAARAVVVQLDPGPPLGRDAPNRLAARLSAAGLGPTTALDDETLFSADAAITSVAAAIAESGTIVCTSGPRRARGASLIVPIHLAVVRAAQLVPDLYDYLEGLERAADRAAGVSLISGPSKTSDIEGTLVTGVHGPRHLHVLLIRP